MSARFIIPLIFLAASCGAMDAPTLSAGETSPGEDSGTGSTDLELLAGVPSTPLIIREATVEVEVDDCQESVEDLRRIAADVEGFVSSARDHAEEGSDRHSARVVMRIPASRFDAVLEEVADLSLEVHSQTVTSADVTEEYVDLEARLRVKRNLEERYLQILSGAANTSEALEVEGALATVREDIERIEGRRQFLRNRADMSTVTIELNEPEPMFAWVSRAVAMGERLCTALLASLLVLAVGTSPLLLMLAGVLLVVQIRRRQRRVALAA